MPRELPPAENVRDPLAVHLSLQPGERVLRRRTRALIAAAGLIATLIVLAIVAVFVVTGTDWGHDRIRGAIVSTVSQRLARGATLSIGRLSGGVASGWTAESLSLSDARGKPFATVTRLTLNLSLAQVLRGDVRLGVVLIDGAVVRVEQHADGKWNTAELFAPGTPHAPSTAPRSHVAADSIEITNSRLTIVTPDTLPSLPPRSRTFAKIHIAAGATTLASAAGGDAPLRVLSTDIDNPAVDVVSASGALRWWDDSLHMELPELRLPKSRASARGTIGWPAKKPVHIAIAVTADTLSLADVHRIATAVPQDGMARAKVSLNSAGDALRVDVDEFDVRAAKSHVSGSLTVTPGKRTELRGVAIAMQPVDLALIRAFAGDSAVPAAWRGVANGRLVASGGTLDSLVVDTLALTWTDERIGGVQSRVAISGGIDLASKPVRLLDLRVRLDSFDLRTLGAAVPAADSLHGVLVGGVRLNGPVKAFDFSDLSLRHVDGTRDVSRISGSGHVAAKSAEEWLTATLSLDSISIASLARDRATVPLRGVVTGQVGVHATGDTLSVDALLRLGDGSAHLFGSSSLDSARTGFGLSGSFANLDPRTVVAKREIPAMKLGGRLQLSFEDDHGRIDRHARAALDSTSRIGTSRILGATLEFGTDSTGFHIDTAVVQADSWLVKARGRLALHGQSSDSVTFSLMADSLGAFKSILLDSTGAPRIQNLDGRVKVDSGAIIGSFESARLRGGAGATALQVGSTTVGLLISEFDVADLPHHATGRLGGTATAITMGARTIDLAHLDATVTHGDSARISGRVEMPDSIGVSARATVTWPDSVYQVRVDSFLAAVGEHRWALMRPASASVSSGFVSLDSMRFRSDTGAKVLLAGTFPDKGPVNAYVRVDSLVFEELAFLHFVPTEVTGRMSGDARITGTRDAPVITLKALLDSIHSEDGDRAAVEVQAKYDQRRLNIDVMGKIDEKRGSHPTGLRQAFHATGNVPLDLSLREVKDRIIDSPMTLHLTADSVPLADFEGLAPRVERLGGSLTGAVDVGGTLRQPTGRGTLALNDGGFSLPRWGFSATGTEARLELAGDSIIVHRFKISDSDSRTDTAAFVGSIFLGGRKWTEWTVNLHSTSSRIRVIEDPRLATAEAAWDLDIKGRLAAPSVTGNVRIPYGIFVIGPKRRSLPTSDTLATQAARLGIPNLTDVQVSLGSDVRLKSKDANVQLSGDVVLFGPFDDPYVSGTVYATRGTYRVDLGLIKRTFRVDSGFVIAEGTKDVPAVMNVYTSYIVRNPNDDVKIFAHLYGTTDRPRLDLSSDLGSASTQSDIVSYLVFGQQSFAAPQNTNDVGKTVSSAVLLPSLGGMLEGVMGTVLPFFSTLQVTSTVGGEDSNLASNRFEGLLSRYAITGGRQLGTDAFFSVSGGVCTGSRIASTSNVPYWLGTAAEYRPKTSLGAQISIDPGPAPCSRVTSVAESYQIGFDLTWDWKFAKKKP